MACPADLSASSVEPSVPALTKRVTILQQDHPRPDLWTCQFLEGHIAGLEFLRELLHCCGSSLFVLISLHHHKSIEKGRKNVRPISLEDINPFLSGKPLVMI